MDNDSVQMEEFKQKISQNKSGQYNIGLLLLSTFQLLVWRNSVEF